MKNQRPPPPEPEAYIPMSAADRRRMEEIERLK